MRYTSVSQCTAVCSSVFHARWNRWNTMQHTATYCNTLQCTDPYCNTLQHTATHCNTLQHTATAISEPRNKQGDWMPRANGNTSRWCPTAQWRTLRRWGSQWSRSRHSANTPQHTAAHCNMPCNTLHCNMPCNTLLHTTHATHYSTLQHALQHTATHYTRNTLQHSATCLARHCTATCLATHSHCCTHCTATRLAATCPATHCTATCLATHCYTLVDNQLTMSWMEGNFFRIMLPCVVLCLSVMQLHRVACVDILCWVRTKTSRTGQPCTVCCRCAVLCCRMLQCVLQCAAVWRNSVSCTPEGQSNSTESSHVLNRYFYNMTQHTATQCNTLQHTAAHYHTLCHISTHCNTL